MTMRRPGRDTMRLTLLAGWLFADLFLVLLVIAFSLTPQRDARSSTTSARPQSPSPSPSPSSETIKPPVLERVPVDLRIPVDLGALEAGGLDGAAASGLVAELDRMLAERASNLRRAGFVLVFAAGPATPQGINTATARARLAFTVIQRTHPAFGDASGEGYWSGGSNFVEIKVFFYA